MKCAECGKEFQQGNSTKPQKFCSRECGRRWHNKRKGVAVRLCECGNVATRIKCGESVCERCHAIEERYPYEFAPDSILYRRLASRKAIKEYELN